MKYKFEFEYELDHELKLGNIYYTANTYKGNYQEFKSNCPVCDDKGYVILNNTRYCCPRCTELLDNKKNPNVVLYV